MNSQILQTNLQNQPDLQKGKVLIFDPDIGHLARLSRDFEERGFEVHACMSVEKALRYIEKEAFDLALLDQVSPMFEGRRVIRHLIRYNPMARFIVMANRRDMECYWQARTLGALDYLEKPISGMDVKWMAEYHLGTFTKP